MEVRRELDRCLNKVASHACDSFSHSHRRSSLALLQRRVHLVLVRTYTHSPTHRCASCVHRRDSPQCLNIYCPKHANSARGTLIECVHSLIALHLLGACACGIKQSLSLTISQRAEQCGTNGARLLACLPASRLTHAAGTSLPVLNKLLRRQCSR